MSRDIQLYIKERLVHDNLMKDLSAHEPVLCTTLTQEIGQAAQYVFLWVELVVKSLLNGLSNQDRIEDLLRRLRAMPRGLEAFYENIVINVDNIYQEEASRLHQLMAVTLERPDDWKPAQQLSLVSVFLAIHQEELEGRIFMTAFENKSFVLAKCKETDIFLRTRCGGLLELQYKIGSTEVSPSLKVSYIHRSVMEYLEERAIRRELLDRTVGAGPAGRQAFIPDLAILKDFCFQSRLPTSRQDWFNSPAQDHIITYARRVDQNKTVPEAEWVRLFDTFCPKFEVKSMLPIAVQGCMIRYLGAKLSEQEPKHELQSQLPLLNYALVPTPDSQRFIRPEVSILLLSSGGNPNQNFQGQIPWQNALTYLLSHQTQLGSATRQFWIEIVIALLENGANPLAQCQGPEKFAIRGKLNKKVSVGNMWTAKEVLCEVFSGSGPGLDRIETLLRDKSRPEKKSKCSQQ